MFAVGHVALAYLAGKTVAKPLRVSPNIPMLLVLSIIPDLDILVGESFHRGPTHSAIAALLIFIPALIFYRKRAAPYLTALTSHAVIGDLLIGGDLMLFWPLSTEKIFLPPPIPRLSIYGPANMILELSLFTAATAVMLHNREINTFFQPRPSNLLLTIPITTVLLPTFLSYPLRVPLLLALPHLFYLIIFSIAVLKGTAPTFRLVAETHGKNRNQNKRKTITTPRIASFIRKHQTATASALLTAIIVAVLAAYTFLAPPWVFNPPEVTVTGTITAPDQTLTKIIFINTSCGTRTETPLHPTSEKSATYTTTLENGYTYNIYITHLDPNGTQNETKIDTLTLHTNHKTITHNLTTHP